MAEEPETGAGRATDRRLTASKNVVWKLRSKKTIVSAAVTGGMAKRVRNAVTSIIHVKTGIRMRVMPGARQLRIVTMKFSAEVTDPMPNMMIPMAQKSAPRPGSTPADIGELVSGV